MPIESTMLDFIRESNRIEGILREPTQSEITAHNEFLALPEVQISNLQAFVRDIAGAELRDRPGMDVRVGAHFPPPGGGQVATGLEELVDAINAFELPAFEAHLAYEKLHPFMDGNGRSGRVLWAWQMQREGKGPFALPFLHRFYYQALAAGESDA